MSFSVTKHPHESLARIKILKYIRQLSVHSQHFPGNFIFWSAVPVVVWNTYIFALDEKKATQICKLTFLNYTKKIPYVTQD